MVVLADVLFCRIFHRLGLITDESDIQETVRYIDIVFVAYGQVQSNEFGIDKGICLTKPQCHECGLTTYCQYQHKNV